MVDDDPEVRNSRAQRFDTILWIGRAAADDVQRHAATREVTQIPKLCRIERDGGRAPQEAADADKPVIARESFEVGSKIG